jgi:hypothetical protein
MVELHMTFVPVDFIVMVMENNFSSTIILGYTIFENHICYH